MRSWLPFVGPVDKLYPLPEISDLVAFFGFVNETTMLDLFPPSKSWPVIAKIERDFNHGRPTARQYFTSSVRRRYAAKRTLWD